MATSVFTVTGQGMRTGGPPGPISGAFKTSPRYLGYAPTDNRKNWGVGVNPDHAVSEWQEAGFPPPVPSRQLEIPPFLEDFFDPESHEPPYGPVIDNEPKHHDDPALHDNPFLPYGRPDSDAMRQASGVLHSVSKGADKLRKNATMVTRGWETRVSQNLDSSLPPSAAASGGPISGQALRALRGPNALGLNNPGTPETSAGGPRTRVENMTDTGSGGNYVRQGRELTRYTNRLMRRRGLTHTKRELHVNLAETATNRPGQQGPYTSPFDSFARLNIGAYIPSVRREPRPYDEDIADDYSTGSAGDDASQYRSWGL